jgi:hypothetical protein
MEDNVGGCSSRGNDGKGSTIVSSDNSSRVTDCSNDYNKQMSSLSSSSSSIGHRSRGMLMLAGGALHWNC